MSLAYIMSELEEREREETFRLKRFKGSKMKKTEQEIAAKKILTDKFKIDLDIIPEIVMTLPVEEKPKELGDVRIEELEKVEEITDKDELEVKQEPVNKEEPKLIQEPDFEDIVFKTIEDVCTCCHSLADLDKGEFVCPICKLLNEARDTSTDITINIVPCKTCLPEVTNNKDYFEHLMAHVNQVINMTKQYKRNSTSLSDIQENIDTSPTKDTYEQTSCAIDIKQLTGKFLQKDKSILPPKTPMAEKMYTSVCTCLIEEQQKPPCPCDSPPKSESCLCPSLEVVGASTCPTPIPSKESCSCPTPQLSPNHLSYNASYLAGEINSTAFCVNPMLTNSDYQQVSHVRSIPTDSNHTYQAPCCLAHCTITSKDLRLTKASDLYLKQQTNHTFLNDLGQRIASASAPYLQSRASQQHAMGEQSGFKTATSELPQNNYFSTYVALTPQFHNIFAQHCRGKHSTSCSSESNNPSLLLSETCSCNISKLAASLSTFLGIDKSNYKIDYISYTRDKNPENRQNAKSLTQTDSSNTLTFVKVFETENSRYRLVNELMLKSDSTHEFTEADDLSYELFQELEQNSSYEIDITNKDQLTHTYLTMFQQQNTFATQEDYKGYNTIILFLSPHSPYTREGQPGPCGLTNNLTNKCHSRNAHSPCGKIITTNDDRCNRSYHICSRQGEPSPCGLAKCNKAPNVMHQQLEMPDTRSFQQQVNLEQFTREGKAGPCGLESSSKPQFPVPHKYPKEISPVSSVKNQPTDMLTNNQKINDNNIIFDKIPVTRKLQSFLVHYIIDQTQLKAIIDNAAGVDLASGCCGQAQGSQDYHQILTQMQAKIQKASVPYISKTDQVTELCCGKSKVLANIAKAPESQESCSPDCCMPDDNCMANVPVPKSKPSSSCIKSPKKSCCATEKTTTPKTASMSSAISRKSTTSKTEQKLGYFETEYEEITKISRYKDECGSLVDQKQVITITTEKKYPKKPRDTKTPKMPVSQCKECNAKSPDTDNKTCRSTKSDIVKRNNDIAPCPKIRPCLSNNDKLGDSSDIKVPDSLKQQILHKSSCKSCNSGQTNKSDSSCFIDECDCSTSMSNNTLPIPQCCKAKDKPSEPSMGCVTCKPSKLNDSQIKSGANKSSNASNSHTIKIIPKSNENSCRKSDDELVLTNSAIDLLRKLLLSSKSDACKNICDISNAQSDNGTCSLCVSSQDQRPNKETNCCSKIGSNIPDMSTTSRSITCQKLCQPNKVTTDMKPSCCLKREKSGVCFVKKCPANSPPTKCTKDVGTSTRLMDKYDIRPIYIAKKQNNKDKDNVCKCRSDDRVHGKSNSSKSLHNTSSTDFCFHKW